MACFIIVGSAIAKCESCWPRKNQPSPTAKCISDLISAFDMQVRDIYVAKVGIMEKRDGFA